jgi:hypothetical protein
VLTSLRAPGQPPRHRGEPAAPLLRWLVLLQRRDHHVLRDVVREVAAAQQRVGEPVHERRFGEQRFRIESSGGVHAVQVLRGGGS